MSARRQASDPDPGPAGRPDGPAAGVSRRRLLAGAGALGAGILASPVAGGTLAGPAGAADDAAGAGSPALVPFHGRHQAGIATAQQRHLVFAGYDLTAGNRAELGELLAAWTAAAARMTAGEPLEGPDRPADPPPDTGEAVGLGPSRLTLTVGFGPGMFDHDRYGLGHRRPAALATLPHFPGDELDPARSGGDLCVQSCADSLQVAFHAVHELTRIGLGAVTLRYYQLGFGFGSAGAAPPGVDTPRNLLGFHDGTANRAVEQPGGLDRHVWVGAGTDQPWLRGGTFLVARRVRIGLEAWARTALEDQEAAVGRHKLSGAPLGGRRQDQAPDFAATGPDGRPRIPASAHIRLASPGRNGGVQILRRSYNFADGVDPRTGELDAGLFFICFQRDPARQFARIQGHLATADALTTGYLRHTASAVFACPPGVAPGRHWGSALGLD